MLYFLLLCVGVFCIRDTEGAEFFESVNARLICYEQEQEDCEISLPINEAYPEYGWSHVNLTKAETHLYLFTKNNPDDPELLHLCAGDLPLKTNFNPNCPTEIYLPGFVSGVCNFAIYRELKDERLKCGCYNVILVDWMWGNIFDLIEADLNMKIVAKHVVIMMRNIMERYPDYSGKDFILTGHSYGAHMAAFISQEERVGVINGLDPSGVVHTEQTPLDERLDPDDADCVQVTHCNAGECLPLYFAVNFSMGTMDFWFNGGLAQPACYPQMLESYAKGDFIYATLSLYWPACQHFQCLQYYKASMCPPEGEECKFLAMGCENPLEFRRGICPSLNRDCGPNGENCAVTGAYACDCVSQNQQKYRDYYLNTKIECPFCDDAQFNANGYTCDVP